MSDNPGAILLNAINSGEPSVALLQIQQYRDNMRNPLVGVSHVGWITDPQNLVVIHTALTERLAIPLKILAIRRGTMNRTQRAVLLVLAMEMAMKKVYGL